VFVSVLVCVASDSKKCVSLRVGGNVRTANSHKCVRRENYSNLSVCVYCMMSFLRCPWTLQILNPQGHPVTAAVHGDTIKGTVCTTGPTQTVANKCLKIRTQ